MAHASTHANNTNKIIIWKKEEEKGRKEEKTLHNLHKESGKQKHV